MDESKSFLLQTSTDVSVKILVFLLPTSYHSLVTLKDGTYECVTPWCNLEFLPLYKNILT